MTLLKRLVALVLTLVFCLTSVCSCALFEFDDNSVRMEYREFVKSLGLPDDNAYYGMMNIDFKGAEELFVINDGLINIYTYRKQGIPHIKNIGELECNFFNSMFCSQNEKFPGVFVRTTHRGLETYSYISVKNRKVKIEKLWDEDVNGYYEERPKVMAYSNDKKLIEYAKTVYKDENNFNWYPTDIVDYKGSYFSSDSAKHEEYNYLMMLYDTFLSSKKVVGGYALYDVNNDTFPELLVCRDESFEIYAYVDDRVQRMYGCVNDYQNSPINVLTNGDVLIEHNGEYVGYTYDDLGDEFETIRTVTFGRGENGEYIFDDEVVSEEKWQEFTEQYIQVAKVPIVWLPNVYADYERARLKFVNNPENNRDIGAFVSQTEEIIRLEGKYYQSYVDDELDIRYILLNQSEREMWYEWGWIPIGTSKEYSLSNIDKMS